MFYRTLYQTILDDGIERCPENKISELQYVGDITFLSGNPQAIQHALYRLET